MEHSNVSEDDNLKAGNMTTKDYPTDSSMGRVMKPSKIIQKEGWDKRPGSDSFPPPPTKRQRTGDEDEDDMPIQDFIEPPEHQSVLASFYSGKARDSEGRYLSEILNWGDQALEYEHDYIQWLFPLPEYSTVNPKAPLIDRDVFASFHTQPELRERLKDSFIRMLAFYGFRLTEELDKNELPIIVKAPDYSKRSRNWLVYSNHNHQRISRIIRCLRILGLESEALSFYKIVSKLTTSGDRQLISCRSADYWRRAAERQLNWSNDLPEDVCNRDKNFSIGLDFLKEYEKLRVSRELQKQHDRARAENEAKEAAWLAEKAHIDKEKAAQEERQRQAAMAVHNNNSAPARLPRHLEKRMTPTPPQTINETPDTDDMDEHFFESETGLDVQEASNISGLSEQKHAGLAGNTVVNEIQ